MCVCVCVCVCVRGCTASRTNSRDSLMDDTFASSLRVRTHTSRVILRGLCSPAAETRAKERNSTVFHKYFSNGSVPFRQSISENIVKRARTVLKAVEERRRRAGSWVKDVSVVKDWYLWRGFFFGDGGVDTGIDRSFGYILIWERNTSLEWFIDYGRCTVILVLVCSDWRKYLNIYLCVLC